MARKARFFGLPQVPLPLLALVMLSLAPAGQTEAKDLTGLADVSGDGQPDVATFAEGDDPSGIRVTVFSGANGRELHTITFLDGRYQARVLERVVQMPATGLPALAVLATRVSNNRHVAEVRDAATGDFIAEYRVLNSLWEMVDLTVIDDLDGDGTFDDPALAILARLPKSGKILVQIIRLSDGVVLANRAYLNRLWTPLAIAAAHRPGMPSVLAILALLPSSNKLLIESRFVSNGVLQRRSRPLNRLWAGQDLSALADLNGDGDLSDPAWLVLARNPNSGANVIEALQVSDGASAGLQFVLNRLWATTRLATSGDIDGNDQEELLVSASRAANGNSVINISDFASGESVRNIFPPPPLRAPANPIVYMADQDTPGTPELFLIDPTAPGVSAKINGPLVAGGEVGPYALSPDRTHVAYVADQDSAGVEELYIVDLAKPGMSTKLNAPLVADGDVRELQFSPDGSQIAYRADQEVDAQRELYLVNVTNPGISRKINGPLPNNGDVAEGFLFSPDGTQVLYAADRDVDNSFELFLVELSALGVATKVNSPFVAGGNLALGYKFSPDGKTIGYMADQEVNDRRELFAVAVNALGISTKLNGPLIPGGDLCRFEFSPDSTHVAYCADQDTFAKLELYLVDLSLPGVSPKLNPPLVAGGEVSPESYRFGPDSSFIIYRAEQDTDTVDELYRVEIATPGVSVKVNDTMVAGGDVEPAVNGQPSFRISPDGLQVSYIAEQDVVGLPELYSVDLATPGASVKLNPPMRGSGALLLDTTADSRQVIYTAAQDSNTLELYRVNIAAPGAATKLSDDLAPGGQVFDFSIAAGLREP